MIRISLGSSLWITPPESGNTHALSGFTHARIGIHTRQPFENQFYLIAIHVFFDLTESLNTYLNTYLNTLLRF